MHYFKRNSNPTEEEIRDALSGNLCRCTGYVKPVQAVQRAAAIMRGEKMAPISKPDSGENFQPWTPGRSPIQYAEHEASKHGEESGAPGIGEDKDPSSQEDGASGGRNSNTCWHSHVY